MQVFMWNVCYFRPVFMAVGKWQQILVKISRITFGANPPSSSRAAASCWSSRRTRQHSSQRGTNPVPPVNRGYRHRQCERLPSAHARPASPSSAAHGASPWQLTAATTSGLLHTHLQVIWRGGASWSYWTWCLPSYKTRRSQTDAVVRVKS
jgi:hypothetical protein